MPRCRGSCGSSCRSPTRSTGCRPAPTRSAGSSRGSRGRATPEGGPGPPSRAITPSRRAASSWARTTRPTHGQIEILPAAAGGQPYRFRFGEDAPEIPVEIPMEDVPEPLPEAPWNETARLEDLRGFLEERRDRRPLDAIVVAGRGDRGRDRPRASIGGPADPLLVLVVTSSRRRPEIVGAGGRPDPRLMARAPGDTLAPMSFDALQAPLLGRAGGLFLVFLLLVP